MQIMGLRFRILHILDILLSDFKMVNKRQTVPQLSVLNIMQFHVSVDSCIIFVL